MAQQQQSPISRPSPEDWNAESLRLTVFQTPVAQIADPTWWSDLVGEPPESRISRPRVGGQQEEGSFERGRLVLRNQPTRIDWLYNADIGEVQDNIPTIGSVHDARNVFLELMQRWFQLETFPLINRMALGVILTQPVETKREGYRRLSTYIPSVQLDVENTSDFIYQINRPRSSGSGVPELRINRLTKWSVALWRGATISMGPESVQHSMGQELFACRLELDISTAPGFTAELPQENLRRILEELADLADEIAREGDIP